MRSQINACGVKEQGGKIRVLPRCEALLEPPEGPFVRPDIAAGVDRDLAAQLRHEGPGHTHRENKIDRQHPQVA